MQEHAPSGMCAFTIVWLGQVVSLIGTAMTQLAITFWAWELTGEATALAAVAVFSFAPAILFSPIAGALVDRSNRKLVMMISDLAAGITTIALYATIRLGGIMLIDIVTFIVAIGALLVVHIPQPAVTAEGRAGQGSLWKESLYGFRYIRERRSLLGLQIVFFFANLAGGVSFTLLAPMILSRTVSSTTTLGFVNGVGAAGGLVGGLLLSTWGGPKRRVHGVLLGNALAAFSGGILLGLGQGVVVWVVAVFLTSFLIPVINGSNQSIWQSKVAPDVQGRVFATRRLIAQISGPPTALLAGILADRVFEPAMQVGGSLAPTFGGVVGTGPGAGMALLVVASGIFGILTVLGGYAFPDIRNAEDILPDHDALSVDTTPAAATGTL